MVFDVSEDTTCEDFEDVVMENDLECVPGDVCCVTIENEHGRLAPSFVF